MLQATEAGSRSVSTQVFRDMSGISRDVRVAATPAVEVEKAGVKASSGAATLMTTISLGGSVGMSSLDTQRLILRVQLGILVMAFSIAFAMGALAPAKGNVLAPMALPEWSDGIKPFSAEVEAFASRISSGYGVRPSVALEFSPWILEASARQHLAPELLAGLVLTESSFRKHVISPVGAVGPAQVRPDYWSQFCGTADLRDPEENIYCGAQILAHYKERCGAEDCALSAYNIGPYSGKRQAGERYVAKVGRWKEALEIAPVVGSEATLTGTVLNESIAVQTL